MRVFIIWFLIIFPKKDLYSQIGVSKVYDTEKIHMYLARGLSFSSQDLDEGEFLDVKKMPLKQAFEMAMNNELPDAKSQLCIIKAYLKLHG